MYNSSVYILTILPVVAAGLVPLIVGAAWYHPRVFGRPWVRLMRVTPEMADRGQPKRLRYTLVSLVGGLVTAFVMRMLSDAWGAEQVPQALALATLAWAGFMIPTSLGDVLWELKPFTLYAIDALYWLVSFILMALILLI